MNYLSVCDFEKNHSEMVSEYVTAHLPLLLSLCCSDAYAARVTWSLGKGKSPPFKITLV